MANYKKIENAVNRFITGDCVSGATSTETSPTPA